MIYYDILYYAMLCCTILYYGSVGAQKPSQLHSLSLLTSPGRPAEDRARLSEARATKRTVCKRKHTLKICIETYTVLYYINCIVFNKHIIVYSLCVCIYIYIYIYVYSIPWGHAVARFVYLRRV